MWSRRRSGRVMSDLTNSNDANGVSLFPTRSYWHVDGEEVEIVLLSSMETYSDYKIVQNFREKVRPFEGENDRQLAKRQFNYTLDGFLSSEVFLGQLKSKYVFKLEEFLEL